MSRPFSETFLGKLRAQVGPRLLQVPAFRCVIEDGQGRILLQLRSDYKKWGLPGGHPEENESLEDCIRREVTEETGLRIADFRAFGFSSEAAVEVIQYPNGDNIHSFALLVHTRAWQGELDEANDESLALNFFSLDELPEMIPPEARSVEMFREFRASGEFQMA